MGKKRKVGLRELKNRLSQYVRQVRAGHGILVTDRGQVVAELGPAEVSESDHGGHAGLATLVKRGSLSLGVPNKGSLYPSLPRLLRRGTVQRLLDEERGEL